MFNYVFPIFAFGLVISAVVFLGLQQAADLAKDLALQRSQEEDSRRKQPIAPPPAITPVKPPAH